MIEDVKTSTPINVSKRVLLIKYLDTFYTITHKFLQNSNEDILLLVSIKLFIYGK